MCDVDLKSMRYCHYCLLQGKFREDNFQTAMSRLHETNYGTARDKKQGKEGRVRSSAAGSHYIQHIF